MSPSALASGGAISELGSPNNLDAGITYRYDNSLGSYMIGLSAYNTDASWTSLGYSVYITQNQIYIYESGSVMASYRGIENGDRITIMREGNQILYYKNSTEIHRSLTTVPLVLYADMWIEQGMSPIIYSSFCTGTASNLSLSYTQPTINDCTTGAAEGSVLFAGNGGTTTYSYQWEGTSTANPRTAVQRGLYDVSLTSGTATLTCPIVVGGLVNWSDLTNNTTQVSGSLTALSTAVFDWSNPAGGFSSNRLAANAEGGISYVIPSLEGVGNYQIGLSSISTAGVSSSWDGQGYSVWIGFQNSIIIYESGVKVMRASAVSVGDRISILRKNGNIEYYLNSELIKTTNGVTQELAADISVITGSSPNVYASFCNTGFRIANKTKTTEEINLVADLDAFKIYPNPSTGLFKVHFGTALTENIEVTIFDGIGRKINTQTFEKGNQDFNVNLNDQAKGMYLIHFNQNGATYSKSIVIE